MPFWGASRSGKSFSQKCCGQNIVVAVGFGLLSNSLLGTQAVGLTLYAVVCESAPRILSSQAQTSSQTSLSYKGKKGILIFYYIPTLLGFFWKEIKDCIYGPNLTNLILQGNCLCKKRVCIWLVKILKSFIWSKNKYNFILEQSYLFIYWNGTQFSKVTLDVKNNKQLVFPNSKNGNQ